MNKRLKSLEGMGNQYPGTGIKHNFQEFVASRETDDPDALMQDALAEDIAKELPTPASKDRGIFERSLAVRRAEKAKQLDIAAAAMAKARELTVSIRAMEDALDGMLVA